MLQPARVAVQRGAARALEERAHVFFAAAAVSCHALRSFLRYTRLFAIFYYRFMMPLLY